MTKSTYLPLIVLAIVCSPLRAADWPCWRGPQYDGISRETGVTLPWSTEPKVAWELTTGPAFSAVTGVGDLVYTCGTENKRQVLFCLNAATGDVVWKKAFGAEVKDRQGGDGTRATPTVNDGKVYIFGGNGTLLCADAKSGEKVWSEDFDAAPHWKYSGSVLIEGDLAVVSAGGSAGGMTALNKQDGKVVWKGGEGATSYSTPYPFDFAGKRYITCPLAKKVIVVEAATGREVASIPWVTRYDVNAATPIYHEGHLFISSGYGHGSILVKLAAEGDGLTMTPVWESKVMANKMQTCILLDGKLYGADERSFKCIDFATGEEAWNLERLGGDKTQFGTLLLCQGHFLFLNEKGKLFVAKASPEGFDPVAEMQVLTGRCWTVPTLINGRLYVRNLEKLVCLELDN